ncbi:MAG: hypothetical protein KatS3mg105_5085 [Gemmatales bacterium]|nr:MAG: hypothetical protein KatS3mg105_5085 [Gemmatales bacterium]
MNYFENTKILAPYDFSEFSRAAVETAMKIAGRNENVTVLHVVDPTPLYSYRGETEFDIGSPDRVESDMESALEIDDEHEARALKMMQGEFADARHHGLHFDTAVDEAAHGIAGYAEQHDFGLIVLPSHGRTGLKRLLIGLDRRTSRTTLTLPGDRTQNVNRSQRRLIQSERGQHGRHQHENERQLNHQS